MGRWVDISRVRVRRDWMLPPTGDSPLESDRLVQYAESAVQTAERRYRTPWARGPRGPLRRNEGVPIPLETPVFLFQEELDRLRERRHRSRLPAVVFGLSALVTALLTWMLSG
ncbi:MAG: hypothetical protein JSU98_00660 [Gemmatimonadales bacterium]|jgi:hypothetical protein|nr:MAG: hypothetical protein JSU98_00660 [Gemmatimonadales bacterium]